MCFTDGYGKKLTVSTCSSVVLTVNSILNDCVLQVFTHPLLAALPRQPDVLWIRAVRSGKTSVQWTSWYTDDPPTSAVAVRVTGGLKGLAILVGNAIELTAKVILTCRAESEKFHFSSVIPA